MDFPDYLRSVGLNVVAIPGWETRQSSSKGFAPVGVMLHHTAGRNSLQYLIDRALVQFHISKSGVVSLISNGRTGHTGVGSGVVLRETQNGVAPSADAGVRKLTDDTYGYKFYYGIEVENLGDGSDPYPKVQLEATLLLTAALCELKGWPAEVAIHHREWTKRKIDMSIRDFFGMSTLEAVRYAQAQIRNVPYEPPAPFVYPSIEELAGLTYRFDRVLGKGDESDVNGDVWLFQEFLAEMGQDVKADGDFGPKSHAAAQAVQRLLDVNDDGLWGEVSASATDRFFAMLHAEEMAARAVEAEKAAEAAAQANRETTTVETAQGAVDAVADAQAAADAAEKARELAESVDQGARAKENKVTRENVEAKVEGMEPETFDNPDPELEGSREGEQLSFVGWLLDAILRLITKFGR